MRDALNGFKVQAGHVCQMMAVLGQLITTYGTTSRHSAFGRPGQASLSSTCLPTSSMPDTLLDWE